MSDYGSRIATNARATLAEACAAGMRIGELPKLFDHVAGCHVVTALTRFVYTFSPPSRRAHSASKPDQRYNRRPPTRAPGETGKTGPHSATHVRTSLQSKPHAPGACARAAPRTPDAAHLLSHTCHQRAGGATHEGYAHARSGAHHGWPHLGEARPIACSRSIVRGDGAGMISPARHHSGQGQSATPIVQQQPTRSGRRVARRHLRAPSEAERCCRGGSLATARASGNVASTPCPTLHSRSVPVHRYV